MDNIEILGSIDCPDWGTFDWDNAGLDNVVHVHLTFAKYLHRSLRSAY